MLPFQVRVELGEMAMNGYSAFPKAPGMEPHDQIMVIYRTLIGVGVLTLLQRCNQCILQLPLTGLFLSFLLL